jgi:general secretion pathway protein G
MNRARTETRRSRGARGFSLVELAMVAAAILVLTGMIVPIARFGSTRLKEIELKEALRTMRNAIDEHKRLSDQGQIPVELDTDGYPKTLEKLVEGVDLVGTIKKKRRFLRRIPVDPTTGKAEWGFRSMQDDPDSRSWGRQNVYDVYSLSDATALDKSKYRDW